jgi:hypothetical protein
MLEESELRNLVGHDLVDENGKSVGYVAHIFNDDETGRPEWIGVLTGTLRHQNVVVPVSGAERSGMSLRVPWPKEKIRQAPTYGERDRGGLLGVGEYKLTISKEKEQQAYTHYGLAEIAAARS